MSVDESPSGSSTIIYSHIPVMAAPTPRPPPLRNAFSSFSMSYLPGSQSSKQQPRHASTSASTGHLLASPTSALSPTNGLSSIPKFRSLRNMLPFGPRSTSTSAPQQSAPSSTNSSISASQRSHSRSRSSSPSPSPSPSVRPNQKTGFLHFSSRPSLNIARDGEKERSLKARPSLSAEMERHRTQNSDQEMPSVPVAGPSVTKPSGISKIVAPRPSVVISREFSPNSIANGLAKEWISRPSPVRSPSPGKRVIPGGG